MNNLKRRRIYTRMLQSRNVYMCTKLGSVVEQLSGKPASYKWEFIKELLPELKEAILNSPYFTSVDRTLWFRPCTGEGEDYALATKAIRNAVLEEAIRSVNKLPLTWWEKCLIW